MTAGLWLLSSWILVGAAVLVIHAVVVVQVMRADDPAPPHRWLAWIPPMAPIIAWRAGRRVAPVLWIVLVTIYVILRLMEGWLGLARG